MEIHFDGTYDPATFLRVLVLIEKRSLLRTILRWLALIGLILVLIVGVGGWLANGARVDNLPSLGGSALTALLLGYAYAGPAITRRIITSRMFQGSASHRVTGTADQQGIRMGPDPDQSVHFRWKQFTRSWRDGDLVVLQTAESSLALFRQDFFENDADWERFLKLVEQRLAQPK